MNDFPGCKTCNNTGRVLQFWDRPGGPPGNGWSGCPDCEKDRSYAEAARRERDISPDFIRQMNEYQKLQATSNLPVATQATGHL